ncbi:MAG: Prevent-host-death protein [Acidobacteriaceae bacterium]|nr:Prevent-host-death protein [Acidobacteriaceae bacterium]
MKTIAASKFKATCLAVMDEVQAKREPVIVTKNGKPVAQLVPMPLDGPDPIFGFYKGKLEIVGDIMSPILTEEENEAFFERSVAKVNDRS